MKEDFFEWRLENDKVEIKVLPLNTPQTASSMGMTKVVKAGDRFKLSLTQKYYYNFTDGFKLVQINTDAVLRTSIPNFEWDPQDGKTAECMSKLLEIIAKKLAKHMEREPDLKDRFRLLNEWEFDLQAKQLLKSRSEGRN